MDIKPIEMKKIYTLLAFAFSVLVSNAQIVNIPDANFKAKLLSANSSNTVAMSNGQYVKIDLNEDNEIQLTESQAIDSLNVYNSGITDLTGINSFTNLKKLECLINPITFLDLSSLTGLKSLFCQGNQLTNLNLIANPNIENLYITGNQLTSINFSYLNSLKVLECGEHPISILNLANYPNLEKFVYANSTQLTSATISNCPNLKNLILSSNPNLTSFSFNGIPNVTHLVMPQNNLTNLDISSLTNITWANLEGGSLQTLNLTGLNQIRTLYVYENQLTNLDISTCTSLRNLYCEFNQLESLNIKNGATLQLLHISGNPNLSYICANENDVNNLQYRVNLLGYNCHVNSYCSFTPGGTFYTLKGNNTHDSNNDGCQASDLDFPSLKLALTNGINSGTFISNESGSYSIPVESGTHTFTPVLENPNYFDVSPTTASVTFPDASSPFIQDFCITANGTHNDLEVTALPIGPARPGFDAQYKIIYKNKGTHSQSGTINFTYDDSILQLVSANPNVSSQGTDSLTWSFTNLLPFESREIQVVLNLNSPLETPPVYGGNWVIFSATVSGASDETPDDNTSVLTQTVVNSFDPNDKICTAGTMMPVYLVGKYVNYVIRFENTGTFAAENVIVKDIIDTTKFDITTLSPLSGSHSFTTRIINTNQVEFIFENINLPFDNTNNDGYVAFKIKTKPNLIEGDIFSNSASIYFDYNAPIVTNDYATTIIQPLNTNDYSFSNIFSLSPVPTKNILTITTKESITISSTSIYNTLGQLVQVNTSPSQTIDVSGLESGNYFIKITSDKGTSTAKFIKE